MQHYFASSLLTLLLYLMNLTGSIPFYVRSLMNLLLLIILGLENIYSQYFSLVSQLVVAFSFSDYKSLLNCSVRGRPTYQGRSLNYLKGAGAGVSNTSTDCFCQMISHCLTLPYLHLGG